MTQIDITFPDADLSHAPWVACESARQALAALRQLHGLSFHHNPGGGEFGGTDRSPEFLRHFRCQVSAADDVEDLLTLMRAIHRRRVDGARSAQSIP